MRIIQVTYSMIVLLTQGYLVGELHSHPPLHDGISMFVNRCCRYPLFDPSNSKQTQTKAITKKRLEDLTKRSEAEVKRHILDKGEIQILKVPFELRGGTLAWVPFGGGLPMLHVVVYIGANKTNIQIIWTLNDLKDKVLLRTSDDVLAFVRLRTSPTTYSAFLREPWTIEVVSQDWIGSDYFYGDNFEATNKTQNAEVGRHGIVTKTVAQHLAIHKPVVRRVDDGFLVERTLYTEIWQGVHYSKMRSKGYRITEKVNTQGQYQVMKTKYISSKHWTKYIQMR